MSELLVKLERVVRKLLFCEIAAAVGGRCENLTFKRFNKVYLGFGEDDTLAC